MPRQPKGTKQYTVHIHSPIRSFRIQKGRMIWKTLAGTMNERLHEFFKYCYSIDDGYSKKELAFIIYEKVLALDNKLAKTGLKPNMTPADILKLEKYTKYVEHLLAEFRKWLENENLILIADKDENNGMIFYNIMNRNVLSDYTRKRKKIEEGSRIQRERFDEIFQKGRRKRVKCAEELSKVIDLRNKRRNKKDRGDFSADGNGAGVA